jgi:MFS family permease
VALPRSLSPFRHRAYARFWFGAFVSNIGTWMETVGVGILVTKQTHQAGWAGIVAAAAFVPSAFAGLIGGALADRFPAAARSPRSDPDDPRRSSPRWPPPARPPGW